MSNTVASAKSTGGAGYTYEDHVGAYYILQMLSGRQPLGAEYGQVQRVDFQTAESGWHLDDLLIKFETDATEHKLALSVKSSKKVTQSGFSDEFVSAIWQQWLHSHSDCFSEDNDLLGLVVQQLAQTVKQAWHRLLQEATQTKAERLVSAVMARDESNVQRNILCSLRCPEELQCDSETGPEEAARLLANLRLLHMDFMTVPSQSETDCISICQNVLKSGDAQEASNLWSELKGFASSLRSSRGSADLPKTIRELTPAYDLRTFPDHRADWERLTEVSKNCRKWDDCAVGDCSLLRQDLVCSIDEKLSEHEAVALIGESGSGKSAIARRLASKAEGMGKTVLWFDDKLLREPPLSKIERQRFGLAHSFQELLPSYSGSEGLIVLDAVGRLPDGGLRCVVNLLDAADVTHSDSPWTVLFTAQSTEWDHVVRELIGLGVDRELIIPFLIQLPEFAEVKDLLRQCPGLYKAALRSEFQQLFRNLKVLGWIVRATSDSDIERTGDWATPTDIIDWVWEEWTGHGNDQYARDGVLKKLADKEAQSLDVGVSLTELDSGEQEIVRALETSGLVHCERGRVHLQHDLLGDWARFEELVSKGKQVTGILKEKAGSIRWQQAIRLYGEWLLEAYGDANRWRQLLSGLSDSEETEGAVRNLLLESVVFAVNSRKLLQRIWPDLVADNGLLLTRLLRRFLHVGTVPDYRMLKAAEGRMETEGMAAYFRIPRYIYWGPLIDCLERHKDEIPVGAHAPAARICTLWLSETPVHMEGSDKPFPWREEAANLALVVGREAQALKAEGVYFPEDTDEKCYEAALNAAHELPREVSQLALELCRRREEAPEATERRERAQKQREKERQARLRKNVEKPDHMAELAEGNAPIGRTDWPMKDPWPDGPTNRVDREFQELCLTSQALSPLANACPQVASEVILALSIEEPKPDTPLRAMDFTVRDVGVEDPPGMSPPMYFRGPFLGFLRSEPERALSTIFTLVDFATDRWIELKTAAQNHSEPELDDGVLGSPEIVDSEEAEWNGGAEPYSWHRGQFGPCDLISSALMAIEKWLYDKGDNGQSVERWVKMILEEPESAAFAGVLASLAKKEPSLLIGPLMPLLREWRVYGWDISLITREGFRFDGGLWRREGKAMWTLARDWHSMSHRRKPLRDLAVHYMLTDEHVAEFFDETRAAWSEVLADEPTNETLRMLIARFGPQNYSLRQKDDGKVFCVFNWPENLRQRAEELRRKSEQGMKAIHFPLKCRQILDGEAKLDREDVDSFWEELMVMADDEEMDERRRADALCGGIAVLLANHKKWLVEDESRSKLWKKRLAELLNAPPPSEDFRIPTDVRTTRWDCFLGEIAVLILADEPDCIFARRIAVESVMNFYNTTTGVTMRRAFRERHSLGTEFQRLQNLCVLWSALRLILQRADRRDVELKPWDVWYNRLQKRYVERRITDQPLDWRRISSCTQRRIDHIEEQFQTERCDTLFAGETETAENDVSFLAAPREKRRRTPNAPLFDVQVLQQAFDWLPEAFEGQEDVADRVRIIELAEHLLHVTIGMLDAAEEGDSREIDGTPHEYDHCIFGVVSRIVASMHRHENPQSLWEPIFDLGPQAHYWVKLFLQCWITEGAPSAEDPTVFGKRWEEMMKHGLNHELWSGEREAHFDSAKVIMELMGAGIGSRLIGEEQYTDVITDLRPYYEEWAKQWFSDATVLRSFTHLVRQPSFANLLCPAIRWIHRAVSNYDSYDWRSRGQPRLETLVAQVLRTCWQKCKDKVVADEDLQKCFLDTLNVLANHQDPVALQLKDDVLESLGSS